VVTCAMVLSQDLFYTSILCNLVINNPKV
jgi:hypothetical protein